MPTRQYERVPAHRVPPPGPSMKRPAPAASQPETMGQALWWDQNVQLYMKAGLCARCAGQIAWALQLGFLHRADRPWALADSTIKPPCDACKPIVAAFPSAVRGKSSPWRRLPPTWGHPEAAAEEGEGNG